MANYQGRSYELFTPEQVEVIVDAYKEYVFHADDGAHLATFDYSGNFNQGFEDG